MAKLQRQVKVLPQNVLASSAKTSVPLTVSIQNQPASQVEGQSSPAIHVVTAITRPGTTTTTNASTKSPVTLISSTQAGASPLVARLVQQMSAGNGLMFNQSFCFHKYHRSGLH